MVLNVLQVQSYSSKEFKNVDIAIDDDKGNQTTTHGQKQLPWEIATTPYTGLEAGGGGGGPPRGPTRLGRRPLLRRGLT